MSILVGGHHHNGLEQVLEVLETLGHHAVYAPCASSMVKQLCEQDFDVILLDLSSDATSFDAVFAFIAEHNIKGAILVLNQGATDENALNLNAPTSLNYLETLSHPLTKQAIQTALRKAITQYAFSHTSGSMQAEIKQRLQDEQNEQLGNNQYDYLTGLPSRALFCDRLTMALVQAKRNQTGFALMHLNLDRFKRINDSLGHSTGDRLLKVLAQRISERLRAGDTLARLGGDEFLLLLPNVETQAGAATIAEKLMKAFQSPFMLNQQEVHITARLGIALYPHMSNDTNALIAYADLAMSQLKAKRQTGYAFYCNSMSLKVPERFNIERDLRLALARGECFVEFQPQIAMSDSRLLGVEALIRWRHPTRGLIAPDEFIPVAEESRQIIEVDTWMLNQACALLKQQFDQGLPHIQLAVNFSPVFLEQTDFVDILLTTLAKYDFPNTCFELEITENTLFHDMGNAVEKLARLRRSGIGIAIDDFGTGFSALSYLKHLPASTLKIDRSFIKDIVDSEKGDGIVDGIVHMGHSLGLHIVAEGVETKVQQAYLKKINCHAVQGYLTGKAMSLEQVVSDYWQPKSNTLKHTA